MYYFADAIAIELEKCGIRAMVGATFIDFPAPDHQSWDEMVKGATFFVKKWKDHALITPALAPHAPYTVSKEHLQEVAALANSLDVPILIHVAESPQESETLQKEHGLSPVAYLDSIGFWSQRVSAAHMVQVKVDEMRILKQHNVGVVHNAQSNMKLASGIAPIPQYIEHGIRVGLGTDSAASNNDQDMFDEMRSVALLHKIATLNATTMNASQTLELATIGGARALHLEDQIGSLEKGKLADLIVLALDQPHQLPIYDLQTQIVYSTKSTDVSNVMVNGRFVVKDKKILTIDCPSTLNEARKFGQRIRQSLR